MDAKCLCTLRLHPALPLCLLFASCGMKYSSTTAGGIHPAKSKAFKYARRTTYWHPVLDTAALYVRAYPVDSPIRIGFVNVAA